MAVLKGVAVDEFCNFNFVSGAKYSPKGTNLCFVVSKPDLAGNKYVSNIYKREGQKYIQLTAGDKEGGFIFLNEDTILFPGDRDGSKEPSLESKYYSISLKGGEAKKAYTFPIPVSSLNLLPNGDMVMLGSTVPGYEDLYKGDKKLAKAYLDSQKENEDYEIVSEVPWWWNGSTYTKSIYQSVYYYDAKKKALSMLTDINFSVIDMAVTPDKKTVYYAGFDKKAYNCYEESNIYRLDLDTRKTKLIHKGSMDLFLYGMAFGDNFGILMLSDGSRMGGNSNPDFYKLDYKTGKYTFYAANQDSLGTSVGSDARYGGGSSYEMSGDTLYFISTRFDGAYLMKLEDGVVSKVIETEGSADSFAICDNEIALSALWDMKLPELYTYNRKTGKTAQFTHLNDKTLRGKYTAIPERCDAVNGDHDVHGFVLKPINYDPKKKYPVILDIHGGPKTVYGEVYYHEMQYWAGRGFFVIYCNPTGSDGRGDSFADICGKYGTVDYEDIMLFTDAALKTYPAMDKKHLYETGGSYGGFMTNWIVGHTDRFKACATQRSISNWFSFFGVSDIGMSFVMDQNKSDPWTNPEKLWEHSPMKHLDKCKTPTLIIHSLEDYRCPVDQGYQMYSSLIAHGVESRLVLFKGENHDLSRTGKPKHRVKRLNEITGWFESHV